MTQARDRIDGAIDYIELAGGPLPASKEFYARVFGWRFVDYGPGYAAIEGAGVDGGFDADPQRPVAPPLVVLYAHDLEATQTRVQQAGGRICRAIFSFPGGRRFHFVDPAGTEMAVWSDAGISSDVSEPSG